MPTQHPPSFQPGIRFNPIDLLFILIMTGVCVALFFYSPWLSLACATSPLQFFLFCNIFRVRRIPELIWSGLFIILVIASFSFQWPWWLVMTGGFIIGAIIIALETRHPGYHGFGWQRLNPDLPKWFEQQHQKSP